MDANAISVAIENVFSDTGLSFDNLVDKTYDGGSVMSEEDGGVQAKIREGAPKAIYTHCYAHRLNLFIVSCAPALGDVSHFFNVENRLYKFMTTSFVLRKLEYITRKNFTQARESKCRL